MNLSGSLSDLSITRALVDGAFRHFAFPLSLFALPALVLPIRNGNVFYEVDRASLWMFVKNFEHHDARSVFNGGILDPPDRLAAVADEG